MLAFISSLSPGEIVTILVLAVLIFGRRLPEMAARGAVHMQRLRRGMQEFRRESGFDEEIRKARRLIENPVRTAVEEVTKEPASWRPPSPRVEAHPDAHPGGMAHGEESPGDDADPVAEDASRSPSDGPKDGVGSSTAPEADGAVGPDDGPDVDGTATPHS